MSAQNLKTEYKQIKSDILQFQNSLRFADQSKISEQQHLKKVNQQNNTHRHFLTQQILSLKVSQQHEENKQHSNTINLNSKIYLQQDNQRKQIEQMIDKYRIRIQTYEKALKRIYSSLLYEGNNQCQGQLNQEKFQAIIQKIQQLKINKFENQINNTIVSRLKYINEKVTTILNNNQFNLQTPIRGLSLQSQFQASTQNRYQQSPWKKLSQGKSIQKLTEQFSARYGLNLQNIKIQQDQDRQYQQIIDNLRLQVMQSKRNSPIKQCSYNKSQIQYKQQQISQSSLVIMKQNSPLRHSMSTISQKTGQYRLSQNTIQTQDDTNINIQPICIKLSHNKKYSEQIVGQTL